MAALSSVVVGNALSVRNLTAVPCVRGYSDGLSSIASFRQLDCFVDSQFCARKVVIQARCPDFSRRLVRVKVNARGEEISATVRSVPVQVALELINAGHRYLDVRTPEEFASGHIEGAINVPYMHRVGSGMSKNLNFVEDVRKFFHEDSEIVVGCKSGRRSLMAAHEMEAAGDFNGVTDMVGGYDAWIESGLPVKLLQV